MKEKDIQALGTARLSDTSHFWGLWLSAEGFETAGRQLHGREAARFQAAVWSFGLAGCMPSPGLLHFCPPSEPPHPTNKLIVIIDHHHHYYYYRDVKESYIYKFSISCVLSTKWRKTRAGLWLGGAGR